MMKPVMFGLKNLVRGTEPEFRALEQLADKLGTATQRITDPQSGGKYLGLYSGQDAANYWVFAADTADFRRKAIELNETARTAGDMEALPRIAFQVEFDPNFIDFTKSEEARNIFEALGGLFT